MRSASSPAETHSSIGLMCVACLPLGPSTTSNVTRCPSLRLLNPLHFNGGKMREKLFTAFVGRNEPKALDVV